MLQLFYCLKVMVTNRIKRVSLGDNYSVLRRKSKRVTNDVTFKYLNNLMRRYLQVDIFMNFQGTLLTWSSISALFRVTPIINQEAFIL